MTHKRRWIVVAFCFAIGGCTATTKDTHQLQNVLITDDGAGMPGIAVDAKQRFVWAPARKARKKGPDGPTNRILCAEPSPDALSQLASSVAVKAQLSTAKFDADGSIEKSFSEATENIGIRTVTVQVLRDALYRACEAFANGAIDDFGYSLVLTSIDDVMIKLIALETLAQGAVPVDAEGRKLLANAAADKAEADRLEADARVAKSALRDREMDNGKAVGELESINGRLIRFKTILQGVETDLKDEKAKGENADETKIRSLNERKIGLEGRIAEAEHMQAIAKTDSINAATKLREARDTLATKETSGREARNKANGTAVLAAGVARTLPGGSADAVVTIAFGRKPDGSKPPPNTTIIGACLAWFARHDDIKANNDTAIATYCSGFLSAALGAAG